MFVKQKTRAKDAAPLLQPTAVRSDVESNEIWGFPSKPGLQRRSSVASGMNAAQRLKEIMTLQRALLADALAVVRVVSSHKILDGLGIVLSHNKGTQETYELSRPSSKIPYFVSHSWLLGRWQKTLAFATHLHMRFAILLSFISLVLSAAFVYLTRSPNLCTPDADWLSDVMRASIVSLVPGVVFIAAVLWAHLLPPMSVDCFLDKVCIHQTDAALKKQAIDSLDIFLHSSERLLVLWSPEYLTRLWCTYELATFVKMHRDGASRVIFVPSWMSQLILGMFVLLTVGMPLLPLTLTGPLFRYTTDLYGPLWGYMATFLSWALILQAIGTYLLYRKVSQHTAMLKQFSNFRIADAQCMDPRDVEFVHGLIDMMWASNPGASDGKDNFEHFMRHELAEQLEANLGARTRLPYSVVAYTFLLLFAVCLSLGFTCDSHMLEVWGWTYPDDMYTWAVRWTLYGLVLWLFINPITTCAVQAVLARCTDAEWGPLSTVAAGTFLYALVLDGSVSYFIASTMIDPHHTNVLAMSSGITALALLTAACWNWEWLFGREAKTQLMQVVIPDGVSEGSPFQVNTPTGPMMVVCPPGCKGGENLTVTVPA